MFVVCAVYASANVKAGPRPDGQTILWYIWTVLILMAIVAGAALVIVVVGRWAKRPNSGLSTSGDDLSSFRVLYERGEFSQEEYDRIRAGLGKRLRNELDLPAQPAAEAAEDSTSGLPTAMPDPTIARTGNAAGNESNNAIKPS
jgi:hypothetical protein